MTVLANDGGQLPYGDGSSVIFGMENFGNTCYCNLILQCLYYTDSFRIKLISHNRESHPRRGEVPGVKPHAFTAKYESLVSKKLKESAKSGSSGLANSGNSGPSNQSVTGTGLQRNQSLSSVNGNVVGSLASSTNEEEKHRFGKRSNLFGLKFSGSGSNPPTNGNNNPFGSGVVTNGNTTINNINQGDLNNVPKTGVVMQASECDSLSLEQQLLIKKSSEILKLPLLVTRPILGVSTPTTAGNQADTRMAFLQLSLMLLNGKETSNSTNGTASSAPKFGDNENQRSIVLVGIPYADPLTQPNGNPTTDQRKRAALVNGPILNLDVLMIPLFKENSDGALLYALRDIFESMVESNLITGVVLPNWFITKLKEKNYLFRQNNMHHDAHEFCNYLINDIIENLDKEGLQENWCTDIFKGLVTNETKCLLCETITLKEESFLDLSVDVPPGESAYLLTHLLNNFLKLEVLRHQNKFYCNTCLLLQEATKTIKIKQVPEVLIINLKRFKYDEKVDRMVKLFDLILYLHKLRLFNTKTGKKGELSDFSLFELYALVVHIGGGPMHGHYVALCKVKSKLWLLFDDETVEIVDDSYVLRFFGDGPGLASAYILFYRKCHSDTSHVNFNGGLETTEATETFDFGFDVDNMFHGGDELLAESRKSPSPSEKPTSSSIDQLSQSANLLISSVDTLELKKPSMFKKNFTLKSFNEGLVIEQTGSRTSSIEKKEVTDKKTEKKTEKKSSWGLKRKEVKSESIPEQQDVPPVERRKSMFGFKRK